MIKREVYVSFRQKKLNLGREDSRPLFLKSEFINKLHIGIS